MLRALLLLLLAANGLFWAWTHDAFAPAWPGPERAGREPHRLAAQQWPERVVVLPAAAASAAIRDARAAALACLQAGPLDEAALPAAEALLAGLPAGSWVREPVPAPPAWALYAGRVADPTLRRARVAEYQRLGYAVELLETPPELAPGLLLSRHADRASAEAALAAATKAVAASAPVLQRALRVLQLPPAPPRLWLKLPRADAETQARLQALPADALGGGFRPCGG